jgi:NADH-quinone oxidoreductase subunit J
LNDAGAAFINRHGRACPGHPRLVFRQGKKDVDARHKAGHDEAFRDWSGMNVAAAFFYLFAGVCVASAFMVIAAKNPVHSVLFLILTFVNASGLFVLLGAEFLAMILVVVYVGAVAVLFLFVVMMLDVDFAELRQGFLQYLPVGALIGVVFLVELLLIVGGWAFGSDVPKAIAMPIRSLDAATNTEALGLVLYTRYIYFFQAAGVILLVAMIGAIVLTLRHKENVKRQNIAEQVARTKDTAIEIRQVRPGQGL